MDQDDDPKLKQWQTQYFWILARECGGKCAYCGLDGSLDHKILSNFVLDHLVPRVKGGSGDKSNLVLACSRCNGDKANYDPSDGLTPIKLTNEQRLEMISKARDYVRGRRSSFYEQLHKEIRGNPS
jgi:5-methylcytosine-specific restriction protein A